MHQVRILRSAAIKFDLAAVQLSAANEALSEALTRIQDHALTLQVQLAETQEAAAARADEHAAALAAQATRLGEALAAQAALHTQAEALASERDTALVQRAAATAQGSTLAAERDSLAAEVVALRAQVAELQARKQVDLAISVSYEAEFRAQCMRSASLEASCMELRAALAAHERAARLAAARFALPRGGEACFVCNCCLHVL